MGFFIFGAPRTGSTLLRRMLGNHSKIAIPPESAFLIDYISGTHVPNKQLLKMLTSDLDYKSWGAVLAPEHLYTSDDIAKAIDMMHQYYARQHGKNIWGQKTPRLVRVAKQLATMFPNAKFIHTIRDPRAVTASLKRSPAHRNNVYAGACRWALDTALGLEFKSEFPERCCNVKYEELVMKPSQTVQKLCEFLAVDWEPTMVASPQKIRLNPHEASYGHHKNLSTTIKTDSVERWRNELSRGEVKIIGYCTHDLANSLGYFTSPAQKPNPLIVIFYKMESVWIGLTKSFTDILKRRPFTHIWRRRLVVGTFKSNFLDFFAGR